MSNDIPTNKRPTTTIRPCRWQKSWLKGLQGSGFKHEGMLLKENQEILQSTKNNSDAKVFPIWTAVVAEVVPNEKEALVVKAKPI